MFNAIKSLGSNVIKILTSLFQFILDALDVMKEAVTPPYHTKNFLYELMFVGFYSLPIVAMTALFSGAVMALQSYTGFARFSGENTVPMVVAISLTRELAPVLTGLMVTARVGASFAAEIATMRITEQIDALYTLSTNSIKYLITPRVVASMFCMPFLVIVADIVGIMGGYLVGVYKLSFNSANYINNTVKFLDASDVSSGLIKAAVFGIIVSCASCYFGYNAGKGSRGVGIASTKAVVSSSILILMANYIITAILF